MLFRLASLIATYLALLKTSGVMFHGLTNAFTVGLFFAMGGAMQMLFGEVAASAIIALGGADHFRETVKGLLITARCAAFLSFLKPNSR